MDRNGPRWQKAFTEYCKQLPIAQQQPPEQTKKTPPPPRKPIDRPLPKR